MILYKFKSLNNIEHTLDIILNERLYCSLYTELNDPFEGLFCDIIPNIPSPFPGFEYIRKKCQNIDALPTNNKSLRICSLSSNFGDVRLWAYYADSHKGIAVEIDFPKSIQPVNYLDDLPSFKNDLEKDPKKILLKKTTHWEFEKEHRIIHDNEYYPIKNKIKAIYMGTKISKTHKDILNKIVNSNIPIYSTKINTARIEIERE